MSSQPSVASRQNKWSHIMTNIKLRGWRSCVLIHTGATCALNHLTNVGTSPHSPFRSVLLFSNSRKKHQPKLWRKWQNVQQIIHKQRTERSFRYYESLLHTALPQLIIAQCIQYNVLKQKFAHACSCWLVFIGGNTCCMHISVLWVLFSLYERLLFMHLCSHARLCELCVHPVLHAHPSKVISSNNEPNCYICRAEGRNLKVEWLAEGGNFASGTLGSKWSFALTN